MGQSCHYCGTHRPLRQRNFSSQAWSALIAWGEVNAEEPQKPMCNGCYDEFRETLIDRSEELTDFATALSVANATNAADARRLAG